MCYESNIIYTTTTSETAKSILREVLMQWETTWRHVKSLPPELFPPEERVFIEAIRELVNERKDVTIGTVIQKLDAQGLFKPDMVTYMLELTEENSREHRVKLYTNFLQDLGAFTKLFNTGAYIAERYISISNESEETKKAQWNVILEALKRINRNNDEGGNA